MKFGSEIRLGFRLGSAQGLGNQGGGKFRVRADVRVRVKIRVRGEG